MRLGVLGLVGALVVVGAASASADPPTIDAPAEVTAAATRDAVVGDIVSVSEPSKLSGAVEQAAVAAARDAGGAALAGRAAQIDLVGITRGSSPVQALAPGYRIPMGLTVVPVDVAAFVFGATVTAVLARGQLVMGATSAGLRGAQAGDVVQLVDAAGAVRSFEIGLIAADEHVGGAEMVLRTEDAELLGVRSNTRVLIWGFDSRAALDQALQNHRLVRDKVRISRSWDPPNPDAGIGLARTKALLGEFAFRRLSSGEIAVDQAWVDSHVHPRMTFAGVGIRASCHNVIVPAIQGALQELADAGLGGLIDLSSTNSTGGCYSPRLNTVTGNLGFLSRHTWAMALDLNISQNPQGAPPRLDCRVVRVFRKWGFAWGGNFVNPDGMHFEYVGERRDQLGYPSTYCPNVSTASADRSDAHGEPVPADPSGRPALFAEDGLPDEDG